MQLSSKTIEFSITKLVFLMQVVHSWLIIQPHSHVHPCNSLEDLLGSSLAQRRCKLKAS